jgi:hypothetical protein
MALPFTFVINLPCRTGYNSLALLSITNYQHVTN